MSALRRGLGFSQVTLTVVRLGSYFCSRALLDELPSSDPCVGSVFAARADASSTGAFVDGTCSAPACVPHERARRVDPTELPRNWPRVFGCEVQGGVPLNRVGATKRSSGVTPPLSRRVDLIVL